MNHLLADVKAVIAGLGPLVHSFEGKTLLLSGARGYLGRYVVATLVEINRLLTVPCKIIAMDSARDDDRLDWRNVPNITFIQHDVKHDLGNSPLMNGKDQVDYVLHMAGIASPYWYQKLPLETISVAVDGSRTMLDVAKQNNSRYLFTSSSEVYQTTRVIPTPESYIGAIPSLTERSCYDVSKLMGENLAFIYAEKHSVKASIVRIFNSVLGDETVVYSDAQGVHVVRADEAAVRFGLHGKSVALAGIDVPSINPTNGVGEQKRAAFFIGHEHHEKCLQVDLRYGRSIRITKDHSLFTRGAGGEIVATRGADIKLGDYVALASKIDVPSIDRRSISTIDVLSENHAAEDIAVEFAEVNAALRSSRKEIVAAQIASGASVGSAHSQTSKDTIRSRTSFKILQKLGVMIPHTARVGLKKAGTTSSVPANIEVTSNLLWTFGLFVAEGSFVDDGNDSCVLFSSDMESILRAKDVLTKELGVRVQISFNPTGAPTIRISSKPLFAIWRSLGFVDGLAHTKRIPAWVLALPLARLKFFLDGYRAGDGVHSGKKVGHYHEFSTVSEGLKNDLIVAFGRFGLVPSTGNYVSTIKKYSGKKYPFWRVTLGNVTPWDILEWDKGASQNLNAKRSGDVVWSQVKQITPIEPTEKVYDFTIPGPENFITGQGVMAHNSFGPGLKETDRRILPRIASAMKAGKHVSVYGKPGGRVPTRTYTPVANTVVGLFLVLLKGEGLGSPDKGIYNVGLDSPELSVFDLCERIAMVTGREVRCDVQLPPSHYESEPLRRCPDITRLKGLGFLPAVDLDSGLRHFFAWALEEYTGEA